MASAEDEFKKILHGYFPSMGVNFRFRFEQSDKFIVWIIGSDVTAIALLVANTEKLKGIFDKSLQTVVSILFLSILFGLIYKYLSIMVFNRWNTFEGKYHSYTTPLNDIEVEDENEDPRILEKFNEFIADEMGITQEEIARLARKKKKIYPLAYLVNGFFQSSILLFLIGLVVLVWKYLLQGF